MPFAVAATLADCQDQASQNSYEAGILLWNHVDLFMSTVFPVFNLAVPIELSLYNWIVPVRFHYEHLFKYTGGKATIPGVNEDNALYVELFGNFWGVCKYREATGELVGATVASLVAANNLVWV
jgi:hypothetical protein